MHEMRKNYNNRGGDHGSKNDDTPMCERHEANYIQFEGYQNRIPHDSYSRQSHHDLNDSKKSLTELNNDVKNDLEHFKKFFDGAFGGVGDEEVIVGEVMVVTSSSLEMLTNSCLGGIMVSLIFLEGLEEEALVEFMIEWFEEDEDGKKNGKDDLLFN
ncbi:hypothetical protein Tco_0678407 [Tanacetum coccineum]|uniref:Uncharacterized protein n=1 Tax=Tanacetum coccineum TaxID=301880 RepID=A0ABQ4XFW7_9ASTR